ncbi:MAG: AAA family ATPase [Anaerolineales bacterium]|nr:AAA family ATPase [Anaerolineales bacterium]
MQHISLVATKLVTPSLRAGMVPREHLLDRLTAGLDGRLILVSASAGFGKTSLVVDWLHQAGLQAAWLTLEAGENDPVRFWSYLVAALQAVWPALGQEALAMLKAVPPVPLEASLTALINDLANRADQNGPRVLVLDDLHLVSAAPIHQGLAFLVEHLPEGLKLVLITRTDPPLPLPRLRARQQLTELRTADLRFTAHETADFLIQQMKLPLSETAISALEKRTEGWISGLRMAALSLQHNPDPDQFIRAFTGSNRHILDYLLEEVLQHEPAEVQQFLLTTSILNRLSGPLCDALTGSGDGQRMLEHIDTANLFLVALDQERRWYRYHPLFAELLRTQLEKSRPDEIASLHRRAAEWFEARGDFDEAVRHSLTARDFLEAARLIERVALDLLGRSEVGTLIGWLRALPEQALRTRPWLCVVDAWMLILTGQAAAIEARLDQAEEAVRAAQDLPEVDAGRIRAYAAAIRAQVTFIQGGAPAAIAFARAALVGLGSADHVISATTATILGAGYAYLADFPSAVAAFEKAKAISLAGGNPFNAMVASSALAQISVVHGRLKDAHQIYQDGLRLAGRSAFMAPGYTYAGLADVLREWNQLDLALEYATQGVELCRQIGQAEILMTAYTALAKVQFGRGEWEAALATLEEARQVASEISAWSLDTILILQARVRLARGDLESATTWAESGGYRVDEPASFHREQGLLTLARIQMARGKNGQAAPLLARLRQDAEQASRLGSLVEICFLQALNFQAQSDTRQARAALEKALALAEPEGFTRVFLDEGAAGLRLLRQLAPHARVLPEAGTATPAGLIEPLSARELEVLRLLGAGLSNPQIADRLVVSLNTVKAHVKNIFRKLGVHNRSQAILAGREEKLI